MGARMLILGVLVFAVCLPSYPKNHYVVCSATAAKGTVALTFDDGPSPKYTQQILNILEKNHIHATFFVIGENAKAHPEFLRKMIHDGDVVGNHSLTHQHISQLKGEQLYTEVVQPEKMIAKIIGQKPKLFRFPYGAENQRVRKFVRSQGMIPVEWGYTPSDYKRPGTHFIARSVIKHAHSGQVILLHDGPAYRQQTVDALPKIIQGIKKKGLGFSVLCS